MNVNHCGASLSEYIGYQQGISKMSVQFRGVNNDIPLPPLWLSFLQGFLSCSSLFLVFLLQYVTDRVNQLSPNWACCTHIFDFYSVPAHDSTLLTQFTSYLQLSISSAELISVSPVWRLFVQQSRLPTSPAELLSLFARLALSLSRRYLSRKLDRNFQDQSSGDIPKGLRKDISLQSLNSI